MRRGLVIGVVAAVVVAGIAIAITINITTNRACALPAPTAQVPDQLKTIGGFDQPFDPADVQGLQDAAKLAASTLDHSLADANPEKPVAEQAPDAQHYAATVVPLRGMPPGASTPAIVAEVLFYDDCTGRHYFYALRDLIAPHAQMGPLPQFPAVSQSDAAARLNSSRVVLTYASDPGSPVWRDDRSGQTLPAT